MSGTNVVQLVRWQRGPYGTERVMLPPMTEKAARRYIDTHNPPAPQKPTPRKAGA
jgi:hypothetical protein